MCRVSSFSSVVSFIVRPNGIYVVMPISSVELVELGCPGSRADIDEVHSWLLLQEFRSIDDLYKVGQRLQSLVGAAEIPKHCMDFLLELVAGARWDMVSFPSSRGVWEFAYW